MSVGLNVLAYATNREPKGKEESFVSADALKLNDQTARGVIRIAKLIHGGGCNDAPGALVNLLRAASQGELKLQVSTAQFDLVASDPALRRFHMAFMHGRHDFRFTPDEREKLRGYLEDGGMLFGDAICASKEFAAAFRRELQLVLPDRKLERIPPDHSLFTPAARRVRRPPGKPPRARRSAAGPAGARPRRARRPGVGRHRDRRPAGGRVLALRHQLRLEQHEALQCRGYTREDAARIGLNVLMYSLNPDAAAAPAP